MTQSEEIGFDGTEGQISGQLPGESVSNALKRERRAIAASGGKCDRVPPPPGFGRALRLGRIGEGVRGRGKRKGRAFRFGPTRPAKVWLFCQSRRSKRGGLSPQSPFPLRLARLHYHFSCGLSRILCPESGVRFCKTWVTLPLKCGFIQCLRGSNPVEGGSLLKK